MLSVKYNAGMELHEAARALGRRGGLRRAERLSRQERRRIAAQGGRARALSFHAERRVAENFIALEAVEELRRAGRALGY